MPPRHTYWTILFGGQPTSFRASTQEELLPTFKQIQSKHPDAVMMWFARGRLWKSEAEAREAFERARRPAWRERPPLPGGARSDQRDPRGPRPEWKGPPRSGDRGRDWRPGGEHKDPRDRFKVPRDVKRARFKASARRDRLHPPGPPPGSPKPPSGDGGKPHSGDGGRPPKKKAGE
jgi:hypothetical protein